MSRLTTEKRNELTSMLKNSNYTIKEIALKFNISEKTVYNIKKSSGIVRSRNSEEKSKVTNANSTISNTTRYYIGNTVIVSMIQDRHRMPTQKAIFNNNIKDIFDFNYFDSTVEKFLLNDVGVRKDDNDVYHGIRDLAVYISGLSTIQASIIKMCTKYNVNLTFIHYNKETGGWVSQQIFGHNISTIDKDSRSINKIFNGFDIVELGNNLTANDLLNFAVDGTSLITVRDFKVSDSNKYLDNTIYVFKNEADAFLCFKNLSKSICNNNIKRTIKVELGYIDTSSDRYCTNQLIVKTTNWE